MAVAIEQVTHWTRPYRGIACVVVSDRGGWVVTACRSMMSGDAVTTKPPRVCRKCRAGLATLSVADRGEG